MHFLLYSFTHYQEPILPILSHLQYLICTSHQSSGTDLGYTSFFFFWKLAQRAQTYTIHSSPALPSPGSLHLQSWACALLFGEARTLCMCGGMYWCQVSYHVVSWRGQSRGREAERVQLSRESGEMHEHQLLHWLPAGRRDASNWTQPLPEVQCLIFFITVIHTAFHSEPQ